jgi:hypothetical protein
MDKALVLFTENRAQDLRLDYSRYLAPRRLLARVLDVEHRALEIIDQNDERPGCFGEQFAGYHDPCCAVCQLQAACLVRTTADVLPQVEQDHGLDARAQAQALKISLLAVGLMHSLRAALVEPATTDWLKEPMLKHGHGKRPATDVSAYRNPKKIRSKGLAYACLFAAQAAETAWPPRPQGVTTRLGTAIQSAFVIQSLSFVPQRLTYGSPTWKRRVKRDRVRMPELKWVPDGTIFRVIRNKEQVDVHIYQDRLMWRGQAFPTLYEVCAAVCGRTEYRQTPKQFAKSGGTRSMPKTSARRFFAPALRLVNARARAIVEARLQEQREGQATAKQT